MKFLTLVLAAVFAGLSNDSACAQPVTVQLPTFRVFATNTSVLVPDRGATHTGGINRSASSSVRRGGLFPSRAYGHSGSASNVSVSAYIHDFEAMDAAVLAEAARRSPRTSEIGNRQVSANRYVSGNSSSIRKPRLSVADQREAASSNRNSNQMRALNDFQVAQRLLAKGKLGAAKMMLRNARLRADPKLTRQIDRTALAVARAAELNLAER